MRIAFLSIVAASLLYSADPTAGAKGTNIANTALSVFGSKDGVNNRLGQPLMSNTKMTTLDGTKSFDAQMQCPASSKSIGITFIPSGGNDYRLIIKQDTNLDGTYDYTYDSNSLGRTVSGVCTNGTLMCNPAGSWSDCKSYVWDTNNKQVFLRQVTTGSSELGACYCSNSSCGVSTLAPQIYENIGGGISAAIMKSNSLFILSKSEWSFADMTYYLYGQDKTNCTGLGGSNWDKYGEKNPTIYYDAQTPPNTSIADVAIDQGSDPTSYYSMISHQNEVSYNNSGDTITMPSTSSCVIKNTPTEQTSTDSTYTLNRSPSPAQAGWGGILDQFNVTVGTFTDKFFIKTAGTYTIKSQIDNYGSVSLDGQTLFSPNNWPTIYSTSKNLSTGEHTIVTSGVNVDGPWGMATVVYAPDGSVFWNIRSGQAPVITQDVVMSSLNQCQANEDAGCRIKEEQICDINGASCVYTVRDSVRQNITPQKKCSSQVFSTTCADGNSIISNLNDGTSKTLTVGNNSWFYIKRIYQCESQNINLDSSKMTRAAGTAYKTDQSATTMTYTDHTGATVSINNLPSGDECPAPVCTVKRASKSADQFSDNTNRSQTTTGTSVTETVVKTCTKSGTSMTCPTESGETMIEGCSCSGNWTGFQQAVTTLGAVSEAAKDMICSQN